MADTLEELKERRDKLVTRKGRLQLLKEQAERELQETEKEMKAEGTSPETIEKDEADAVAAESTALEKFKKDLDEYERQLSSAEVELQAE